MVFDAFDPPLGEGVFVDVDEFGVCGKRVFLGALLRVVVLIFVAGDRIRRI